MKNFLILIVLLAPAAALANNCEHSQARDLALDLEGITSVRFEVNSHDLRLGAAGSAGPRLSARACASDSKLLDQLVFEQRRSGDTLVVVAERRGKSSGIFWSNYANLSVDAQLPAGLAYEIHVGSGDATVTGLREVHAEVGSGDLDVRNVAGRFTAKVGSGDITASGVGELEVLSVGSGDLEVADIRGDARVRSVNSGDVELSRIGGSVEIGSIGSGDVDVRGVGGNVGIDSIGSGEADIDDVEGDLRVARIGSGDVSPSRVRGRTDVPDED